MRKAILLAVIAAVTLTSCASNQKKAEALVSRHLNTVLNDFKSYEPVSTKVDTLYNLPIWDKGILEKAKKVLFYKKSAAEFKGKADDASRLMDIWLLDFSSYGEAQYHEACNNFYVNSIMSFKQTIDQLNNERDVVEMSSKLDTDEQIGWLITHKFRSNNAFGSSILTEALFLVDKGFKTVNAMYSNSDSDVLDQAKEIKEIIGSQCDTDYYDDMIKKYEDLVASYEESLKKVK